MIETNIDKVSDRLVETMKEDSKKEQELRLRIQQPKGKISVCIVGRAEEAVDFATLLLPDSNIEGANKFDRVTCLYSNNRHNNDRISLGCCNQDNHTYDDTYVHTILSLSETENKTHEELIEIAQKRLVEGERIANKMFA